MEPSSFDGPEGSTVFLRCLAGAPPPRVTWSRQGSELPPNARQDDDGRGSSTLEIPSATAADSGVYVCTAVRTTPPSYITNTVRVVISPYRQPPSVNIEPERQTVTQGSLAELRCVATGDPTPAITWSKANEELSSNTQAVGPVLRIVNIQVQDRGIYICTAESPSGSSQASAVLEVEREYPSGNDTVYLSYPTRTTSPGGTDRPYPGGLETGAENGDEKYPQPPPTYPGLGASSQQTQVPVGGSADLRCTVSGRDLKIGRIFLRWVRPDGRALPHNSYEHDGILSIRNVQYGDDGEYTCQGVSPTGQTVFSASTYVVLIDLPQIQIRPERQVVRLGDSPRFECSVTGPQPTVIRWEAVGRDLPSSATTSGGILQFQGITEADTGRYVCLATNRYGQAEQAAEVIVEEGPTSATACSPSDRRTDRTDLC